MSETKSFEALIEVKNLLMQLKDTSELMVDLAYSAVLFNTEDIAREVRTLEQRVDDLHTRYENRVLSLIRPPEDQTKFLGLLRLGIAAEAISDAAARIADTILLGIEPHPILKLVLEEAEETVTRAEVLDKSILCGKTLRQLRLQDETGMRVIAIRRGRELIINPTGDVELKAGDVLIARGDPKGKERLAAAAAGKIRRL